MNTYKRRKKRRFAEKITPAQQELFDDLCQVYGKLGITVRVETGRFRGGYCLVEGEPFFFLNKHQTMEQKIELLLSQLKNFNTEKIFLSPRIREYITNKPWGNS